jgi:hypothetical protein
MDRLERRDGDWCEGALPLAGPSRRGFLAAAPVSESFFPFGAFWHTRHASF